MRKLENIRYSDAERGLLDFYAADNAKAVVIWFHGGGIESGDKSGLEALASGLAARGIALAAPNYSLYPSARYPDFLRDASDACAFVRDNIGEWLPNFGGGIYVGGTSAGAYISMLLRFNPEFFAANGLCARDFSGYIFDAGQPTVHFNVLRERGLDTRLVRLDESAPLYFVTPELCGEPDAPRMLFAWSDNDMRCRAEQNELMLASLAHMGYPQTRVASKLMRGYGHCEYDDVPEGAGTVLSELIAGFIG